jgi:rod shape-determining protein MreB
MFIDLMESINTILKTVQFTLEKTPPELAADIVDKGMVLVDGGALLRNPDVLLREVTGVPVTRVDDPLSVAVMGAGQVLSDMELLKNVTVSSWGDAYSRPAHSGGFWSTSRE